MAVGTVTATGAEPASRPTFWFPVGEILTYRLYWGIIPVGTAEFKTEWVRYEERDVVRLLATAKTGPIVSALFPVDDAIETLVEPSAFMPLVYTQKLSEGRHVRHDVIRFDHKAGVAYCQSRLTGEQRVLHIDADSRDVLSLAYWMRGKGLNVGEKRAFRVLVDDKIYDLDITGVAQETLDVNGKQVKCLHVEPKARFGAIFVRSGHPEFVFHDGVQEVRITTEPGDYIFVPPNLPHREENPNAGEPAVVVIARSTQEAIVVNLDRLYPL